MEKLKTMLFALAILLSTYQLAFAVDTTQTYQSGFMVVLFLAICAMIVILQLIPALVLFAGTTVAMFKRAKKAKVKVKI